MYVVTSKSFYLSSDALLMKSNWSKRLEVRRAKKGEELSINFISQEWGKLS